jgi:hypothetical protein
MDYKIELQKNNEDLNNIIDKAKALPDASSGGESSGGGSSFVASANGVIPEYERGFAISNFALTFEASAIETNN